MPFRHQPPATSRLSYIPHWGFGVWSFGSSFREPMTFVYPMWSQVIDNGEFDKMMEATPVTSASAK
jgi:hypothetical protein